MQYKESTAGHIYGLSLGILIIIRYLNPLNLGSDTNLKRLDPKRPIFFFFLYTSRRHVNISRRDYMTRDASQDHGDA